MLLPHADSWLFIHSLIHPSLVDIHVIDRKPYVLNPAFQDLPADYTYIYISISEKVNEVKRLEPKLSEKDTI